VPVRDDAERWVRQAIETIIARRALPEPPPPAARKPRYMPKDETPAPSLARPCPSGVPAGEWAEACRNVAAGSSPSTIKKGSDIPSDWTMRRNGFA